MCSAREKFPLQFLRPYDYYRFHVAGLAGPIDIDIPRIDGVALQPVSKYKYDRVWPETSVNASPRRKHREDTAANERCTQRVGRELCLSVLVADQVKIMRLALC